MKTKSREQWRPIDGFAGYEVSDRGRVRSLKGNQPKIMSVHYDKGGYVKVSLCNRGKQCTKRVHRLELIAFVGDAPKGTQGSHLDGDPENNWLSNLGWESCSDNNARKVAHGTQQLGERVHTSKLTRANVIRIRKRHRPRTYGSSPGLAKRYGVHRHTIEDVVARRTWAWV